VIDVLGADRIDGPLLVIEGFGGAAYGEVVEVTSRTGTQIGEVISAGRDAAIIEVWGDTPACVPTTGRGGSTASRSTSAWPARCSGGCSTGSVAHATACRRSWPKRVWTSTARR